jgi:oxygen-dependent protoporphyrinogen oxidase
MQRRVIVVGAGVAGLSAAWRILEQARQSRVDIDLTVLEASAQPGGKIDSQLDEGYLCESGPNGFLDNEPATLRLVDDLGLREDLQRSTDASRRRFLVRGGQLVELSMNPVKFLKSPLLSRRAKWRMAMEFFVPRRRSTEDETVGDFGRRRLGREFTEVMLDSMVSGIYAGDVDRLSVKAAFPKVSELESQYGGLFKGMFARQRQNRRNKKKQKSGLVQTGPSGVLHSFRKGMGQPVQVLARSLGPDVIRTNTAVRTVTREGFIWRVELASGHTLEADAVVMTTPAPVTAGALRNSVPIAAAALDKITIAGVHVVCMGFGRSQVTADTDAFGVLIPRSEGLRTLGSIFSSGTFTGRAPAGRILLTCMIGGRHDPEANELGDTALRLTVLDEVRPLLGVTGDPEFSRVFRWARGIPQYELGHLDRVASAHEAVARAGGIFLGGNSIAGVSFNQCIAHAEELGTSVVDHLLALEAESVQGV